jgi:methyltransferase family protein
MESSNALFDDGFYERRVSGSYRSARVFAGLIAAIFTPKSVVDFGCGRGTWLKAFKKIGATALVGFDGEWNSQENMIEGSIVFNACDLNKGVPGDRDDKFELAISPRPAIKISMNSGRMKSVCWIRMSWTRPEFMDRGN